MNLLKIQIALFTRDLISRPDTLFNKLNEKTDNLFDDIPQILNLPPDAPFEIPVVQGKAIGGKYSINVSRNRVDIFIENGDILTSTVENVISSEKSRLEFLVKCISEEVSIIRIGNVFTCFEVQEDNISALHNRFFKSESETNLKELFIRKNNLTEEEGLDINNLISWEATSLVKDEAIINGILVQYDINNVVKNDIILTTNMLIKLLDKAIDKVTCDEKGRS